MADAAHNNATHRAPSTSPPQRTALPTVTPGFILCSKADLDTMLRVMQGTEALPNALAQARDIAAAARFSYVDVKRVLNRTIASAEACLVWARGAEGRPVAPSPFAGRRVAGGFVLDDPVTAIFLFTRLRAAFDQARRALDAAVQAAAAAGPGVPVDLNYAGMGLAVCTWGEGAAAQAAIVRAAQVAFHELERAMNDEEASAQASGGDAAEREVAARLIATNILAGHEQLRCLATNSVLSEAYGGGRGGGRGRGGRRGGRGGGGRGGRGGGGAGGGRG